MGDRYAANGVAGEPAASIGDRYAANGVAGETRCYR